MPKWPLLWSPKKGQKQRNQVSRFLGTDGNMKKTPKCNDIPRENWVKSPLSKYAYYRRLCSITGWISHFCKKTPISRINLKKKKYHDQKSTRTWFSIYPTISVKMLKKNQLLFWNWIPPVMEALFQLFLMQQNQLSEKSYIVW